MTDFLLAIINKKQNTINKKSKLDTQSEDTPVKLSAALVILDRLQNKTNNTKTNNSTI
ncbi:hypothetical protein [Edwardsiella tarda]|uniref:hypothetical protein n=1 Tax=Edwardsiella tarda TaxID=636 RepID=UPI00351C3471